MTIPDPTFTVTNPADNAVIGCVPDLSTYDAKAMIEAAANAFRIWRTTTGKARADLLESRFVAICGEENELARTITLEQGKPLAEALSEVRYGAAYVKWFAEEARRIDGTVLNSSEPEKRLWVMREPVGVVGAITPWNFPLAMITRKVAAALAAGCCIVVKPAAETPLTAIKLQKLAMSAGISDTLFSLITTTDHVGVGREFTSSKMIRKLSFTGSTATGQLLMQQSAQTVKRLSLELGGNAPFIVFDDADIEQAVVGAVNAKFRNAGQTCVCANRFLVQRGVFDKFLEALAHASAKLVVGNGLNDDTHIGPLISLQAAQKVHEIVLDAVRKGAKVITGGSPHSLAGSFYTPTILTEVDSSMRVVNEEIFGPVVALMPFDTEYEALELANATEAGLAAYLYTEDYRRITRMTEALEFGMVGVNEGIISTETAPFGGIKQSGYGREGSRYGLDDYLSYKYVCLGVSPRGIIAA